MTDPKKPTSGPDVNQMYLRKVDALTGKGRDVYKRQAFDNAEKIKFKVSDDGSGAYSVKQAYVCLLYTSRCV